MVTQHSSLCARNGSPVLNGTSKAAEFSTARYFIVTASLRRKRNLDSRILHGTRTGPNRRTGGNGGTGVKFPLSSHSPHIYLCGVCVCVCVCHLDPARVRKWICDLGEKKIGGGNEFTGGILPMSPTPYGCLELVQPRLSF